MLFRSLMLLGLISMNDLSALDQLISNLSYDLIKSVRGSTTYWLDAPVTNLFHDLMKSVKKFMTCKSTNILYNKFNQIFLIIKSIK